MAIWPLPVSSSTRFWCRTRSDSRQVAAREWLNKMNAPLDTQIAALRDIVRITPGDKEAISAFWSKP